MKIDRQEAARIAKLARLELSDEDLDRLAREMNQILGYMEKLGELDTEGLQPMAHTLDLQTPFRKDVVGDSLDPEKALENAPAKEGTSFIVPRVI